MTTGLDTNVLVYAHRMERPEHEAARAAIAGLATSPGNLAVTPFVLAEFIRVVTHPRTFEMPSSLEAATGYVDELLAHAAVRLVRPGRGYWTALRATLCSGGARGNDAYDAHVVATLLDAGVTRVLTNDRRISRFDGIEVVPLQA